MEECSALKSTSRADTTTCRAASRRRAFRSQSFQTGSCRREDHSSMMQGGPFTKDSKSKYRKERSSVLFPPYNGSPCFRGTASGQVKCYLEMFRCVSCPDAVLDRRRIMRKRCCCNCRHNIRTWDDKGNCTTHCEIDGHYIGYVECFIGWCRRWAKDKWQERGADDE